MLRQQFPPPHDAIRLRAALRVLGLDTAENNDGAAALARLSLPAVAFLRRLPEADNDAGLVAAPGVAGQAEEAARTPALLIKTDGERLLFFRAGSDVAETLLVRDFDAVFEPLIIAVRPASVGAATPPESDDAGLAQTPKPFGLHWFVPELRKHRRIFRDVLLASLAIQLIGLATPLFTQVVIDKVVVHQTLSTLTVVGIGLAIFTVFGALMSWLRQYLVLHTGNRIDAVLASEVFRHLLHLPLGYFQHRPTGTLVARLHGVETVREFVTGAAVTLVLDLPFLAIFLAVMFFYSWQLTLIAVGLLALLAGLSLAVTAPLRARLNAQFLLGARNQSFLTEYVSGMETVKSLQLEPQLEQKYGDYLATYLGAGFKTKQLANTYHVAATALEQTQTLAILLIGALLVMANDGFTVGMLVAFQMFAGRLSQPILRLVGLYQQAQEAGIAIRRLGDILDVPTEPHGLLAQRTQGQRGGRIDIRGLGFRYGADQPWLYRGFHLAIPAGKAVAIMGPSGSGKSTLAKLLQGFYLPEEGSIRIDGVDLRHLGANALRSHFGVVPQDTVLFSGSLYDNLRAADPHASFEAIVEACRMAEIHTAIERLPRGYQTELGERGVGLSGGQKQRLAIARALLKRPKILIFDEATSNLDPPTAEQFARTINRLKGTVTMLFIAHQLPKALSVDAVVRIGEKVTVVGREQGEGNE